MGNFAFHVQPKQMCRATIRLSNRIWGNESVMNYLKHGVFHHFIPLQHAIHWEVSCPTSPVLKPAPYTMLRQSTVSSQSVPM